MRGRLARNTLLASFWQAVRVACQAAWIIVIAHSLGASGLGALSGTLGLAVTLGGLSGLGGAMLLLKNVARQPESFGRYWRQSLVLSACSSSLLVVIFLILSPVQYGWVLLLAIACAELTCAPFIVLCSHAFQAHERMGWHSALPAINAVTRLMAATAFWLFSAEHGIGGYALLHALGSLLGAGLAYFSVVLLLKPQSHPFAWSIGEAREGLAFSALWVTGNATTELDKTAALYVGGGEVAGIYAAAYRFANVMALPIVSLIGAIQPRLFRNDSGQGRLLWYSLVAILGWSVVGGLTLQWLAQFIPMLLGEQFVQAAQLARWLALWMPLYALRILGASVLTSQGRLALRISIECTGLAAMVALAAWAIPQWGEIGAVAMALGTEALLAILAWAAVAWVQRR
jgi:O-antigen/teichoic acid export membrane protein